MAKLWELLPFVLAGGTIVNGNGDRPSIDDDGDLMMPYRGFLNRRHLEDDTWRRELQSGMTYAQAIEQVRAGHVVERAGRRGVQMSKDGDDDVIVREFPRRGDQSDWEWAWLSFPDIDACDWEVIDG